MTAYGRDLRVDLNAARREAAVRRVAERRARLEARASSMTSSSVRTTTTTTMPPGSPRAKEVAELFAPLSLPSSPVRAIARGDDDDDDPSPAKRSNRPSPRRRPKGGGKSPGVLNMIARLERTLSTDYSGELRVENGRDVDASPSGAAEAEASARRMTTSSDEETSLDDERETGGGRSVSVSVAARVARLSGPGDGDGGGAPFDAPPRADDASADEVLKERRSPRERGRMGTSHDVSSLAAAAAAAAAAAPSALDALDGYFAAAEDASKRAREAHARVDALTAKIRAPSSTWRSAIGPTPRRRSPASSAPETTPGSNRSTRSDDASSSDASSPAIKFPPLPPHRFSVQSGTKALRVAVRAPSIADVMTAASAESTRNATARRVRAVEAFVANARAESKTRRAAAAAPGAVLAAAAKAGGVDALAELMARRDATAKVLKERRSPRERGRMGTSHDDDDDE